jgi:predicted ATPase
MARPASRPGNLPAEATSFVGRRRELGEVKQKLAGARLVTLVGPGGVGKTRLAVRAATDVARRFRGGAWLVELAEIHDPGLVGHTVLAALDLRDQTTAEPLTLVLSYLRDKQLLLVVDNCEHLLAAAARLTAAVVAAAPGVRVIATSREPLSVPGEHVVPVPPLDLPSAELALPLARLRQNEAVSLFVERAVAGSGRFALTTANQAAVADLCRRLDGLPLAIELAAVRTRVLTPEQMLDRLTDRFGLLTGGGPAALPRHQTLSTTIDWSHDLLTAGEQALLRRLSVFAGRFTIEAVESVCTAGGVPPARVLDMLSSLVDKSLVHKEDEGSLACYRLHETTREYAGLKLRAAGEREAIALRCGSGTGGRRRERPTPPGAPARPGRRVDPRRARPRRVPGRVAGRPTVEPTRRGRARTRRAVTRHRDGRGRSGAGTARQAGGRGRSAGGRRPEQQTDRRAPVHLGAHSGQSRAQHHEQARVPLTRADRGVDGGIDALGCGVVGEVAGEVGWRAHSPRVDHEFRQPIDAHPRQPQHDQRQPVVRGRREEDVGLTQKQRLLLGFVADVQHRDVGPDDARSTRDAFRVRPDEPLVADPEVEAVAVDLDHVRQRQRQAADIVGVSHPVPSGQGLMT